MAASTDERVERSPIPLPSRTSHSLALYYIDNKAIARRSSARTHDVGRGTGALTEAFSKGGVFIAFDFLYLAAYKASTTSLTSLPHADAIGNSENAQRIWTFEEDCHKGISPFKPHVIGWFDFATMAAPTQEYPPWLTPSAVVGTNAAGELVTSTTIVYLPLTYLGPSIPLNSLYTYGGSTYPPTIVTGYITTTPSPTAPTPVPTTSSATPTTVTTVSDTTSTTSPTTSAPTTSSTSSISSTTAPPPATTTTSSTSSTSPIPTTSFSSSASPTTTSQGPSPSEPSSVGALSRGQLVGVIVASILGLIFLFVFLLALWLWCKGRRNRRRSGEFSTITPLDHDYFIVGEEGGRTPGEGSPRHSGEEADSFLRRSGSRAGGGQGSPTRLPPGMMEVPTEMGTRRPSVPRVPVPQTGSLSSSGSSSTNTSGYGILLDRPTLSILPPTAEEDHPFTGGRYELSDDEMREINRESVLPQEEQDDYTGAYAITRDPELPPPRLIDPDNAFSRPDVPHPQLPPATQQNRFSAQSNPSMVDAEDAALLTARRVHMSDLPTSAFDEEGTPARSSGGFLGAIGLGGLANLGRLSWFNSGDSLADSGRHSQNLTPEPRRRSRRYSPTFSPVPMADDDLEAGRAAMRQRGPEIDSFGRLPRPTMPALDLSGQRPVSTVSGSSASGQTVYHDARSTPATPAGPRVATPYDFGGELTLPEHAWLAGAIAGPAPPPYQDDDPFLDTTGAVPRMDLPQPVPSTDVDDILDMPAPSALTHFQSSHFNSNTGSSDRDSAMSSIGLTRNPFPPGLDFMARAKELTGGTTWTPDGSLSAASGSASSPLWQMHNVMSAHEEMNNDAPTVDILEEEPPEARDTWRSIASATGGGVNEMGRRTTFGLPVYHHPTLVSSQEGSLHSMRSHVNPPSVRSTGSAPASVSIRSSPYGTGRAGSLHSSVHSGSLSSTSSSHRSEASASSSIARELVRSGSIISAGRGRRYDPHVPGPSSGLPPLSPFGQTRFTTPPRSALSQSVTPGHFSGEAVFKDGDIPTVDGPDSGQFSPGASTIRTVNSGNTVQGPRTRTISAVTFGSAGAATAGLGLNNAVVPFESAEEGDLGLLNDANAGRRLGPAWMS